MPQFIFIDYYLGKHRIDPNLINSAVHMAHPANGVQKFDMLLLNALFFKYYCTRLQPIL